VEEGRRVQQLDRLGGHEHIVGVSAHGSRSREDEVRAEHLPALEVVAQDFAARGIGEPHRQRGACLGEARGNVEHHITETAFTSENSACHCSMTTRAPYFRQDFSPASGHPASCAVPDRE